MSGRAVSIEAELKQKSGPKRTLLVIYIEEGLKG